MRHLQLNRISVDDLLDFIIICCLYFIIPGQGSSYNTTAMYVSMIISVVAVVKNRFLDRSNNVLFIFHLVLCLFFMLQNITGNVADITMADSRLNEMLFNLIWGFFIYRYFRLRSLERMIHMLWIVTMILAIYQIATVGLLDLRSTHTSFNVNTLGLYCGYAGAFAFGSFMIDRKYTYLVIAFVFSAIVILTGSRQALLSLTIPFAIIFIFRKHHNRMSRIIVLFLALIIVYVLLMDVPLFYYLVGQRIENLFSALSLGTSSEVSITNRMEHYVRAWALFKQNWLYGYGLDGYRAVTGCSVYSHSNFMELLVAGGIIGFVLYYIPFVYLIIQLFRKKRKTVITYILIGLLCTEVFIEYMLVTYYRHFAMFIYVILLVTFEKEKMTDLSAYSDTDKLKVRKAGKRLSGVQKTQV